MYPVFYPIEGDTLPIPFDTFGSSNQSITITGLAVTDIEVFKDGSTTQRASDNGYALSDTDGIDFDGITGHHEISIDLSDNSDSGFYSVGPWYKVVVSAITVDGQTVSKTVATFRIVSATRGLAGTALPDVATGNNGAIGTVDGSNRIAGVQGTINTLDALDTAQDSQHSTTQSRLPAALTADGNIKADTLRVGGTLQTAGDLAVLLADIPTVAEFNARTLASADYFDPAADTVAHVTLVDTCTTNTDMRGTDGANTTTPPTVGAIADQVWDEAIAGHVGAGSTGAALNGATAPTAEEVADAVWDEPKSAHTTPGSFGDYLDIEVSSRAEAVSAGSGAFVVTVTVDDGSDPLEGVTVRLREGANNFTAVTNASGVATFSLDAATYAISMTKVGYQFTPSTIVVTTAADFPQSMTAITVSASSPGFATGVLTCYDEDGAAEQSVQVMCQIIDGPGTAGLSYDSTIRTETSGADGVVQFTGMVIGATYDIWRSDRGGRIEMTVPNSASFNINELIGKP